jgi:uncharacterized protein (TIGR02246 family)
MVIDDAQRDDVVVAIQAAMKSFEEAQRARDAERLIAHFAPVRDFHVYNDGSRVSYDAMSAAVRATFPTLQSIEGGFQDVRVIVLAPDAGLATATFRETVTDRAGSATSAHGAASWLWRSIDGRWCITYGHVDHYPEPR